MRVYLGQLDQACTKVRGTVFFLDWSVGWGVPGVSTWELALKYGMHFNLDMVDMACQK